jgi:hypothetical protein
MLELINERRIEDNPRLLNLTTRQKKSPLGAGIAGGLKE